MRYVECRCRNPAIRYRCDSRHVVNMIKMTMCDQYPTYRKVAPTMVPESCGKAAYSANEASIDNINGFGISKSVEANPWRPDLDKVIEHRISICYCSRSGIATCFWRGSYPRSGISRRHDKSAEGMGICWTGQFGLFMSKSTSPARTTHCSLRQG